ncbi:late competence development ComFB family protein [Pleurocapsales cyanobacterium LEGE 06147]|nr:late competence development ComFB family protein [Pleurocapsales cyanobacterium LEGE 06147]
MKRLKNQISRNVMEFLVTEEIERQIIRYPTKIGRYINRVEVATYALNRLPPLYASSQEGLNRQKLRGRKEFSAEITKVVRQALAAVQKDLLRSSTPLIAEEEGELENAKNALKELVDFLPHREFSWENLVKTIKPILIQMSRQKQLTSESTNISSQSSARWEGTSSYRK